MWQQVQKPIDVMTTLFSGLLRGIPLQALQPLLVEHVSLSSDDIAPRRCQQWWCRRRRSCLLGATGVCNVCGVWGGMRAVGNPAIGACKALLDRDRRAAAIVEHIVDVVFAATCQHVDPKAAIVWIDVLVAFDKDTHCVATRVADVLDLALYNTRSHACADLNCPEVADSQRVHHRGGLAK
jgi:hypothetical protein